MSEYSVHQLTLALGVNEEGQTRQAAWRKAAEKELGAERGALNRWCKRILDEAAGYKPPKK